MLTFKKAIGIATIGIILISGSTSHTPTANISATQVKSSTTNSYKPTLEESTKISNPLTIPKAIAPTQAHDLSNNNYYTNTSGNKVHSPAYSNNGVPAGASARCGDGTYSFSQSRRGTCSHHGGVAQWL